MNTSNLTDKEVIDAMRQETPINRARRILAGHCGAVEQAYMQRTPPSPIEVRRWEFETIERIAGELGVEFKS